MASFIPCVQDRWFISKSIYIVSEWPAPCSVCDAPMANLEDAVRRHGRTAHEDAMMPETASDAELRELSDAVNTRRTVLSDDGQVLCESGLVN
jgi:hypothetical protein